MNLVIPKKGTTMETVGRVERFKADGWSPQGIEQVVGAKAHLSLLAFRVWGF